MKDNKDERKKKILYEVAALGVLKDKSKNLNEDEAIDFVLKRLNQTVFKKSNITKEELTTGLLENVLSVYDKKYKIHISNIQTVRNDEGKLHWGFMLWDRKITNQITTLFSRSLLEGLSKVVLYLYIYTKD
jgi:hypothetical protein